MVCNLSKLERLNITIVEPTKRYMNVKTICPMTPVDYEYDEQ